jgi:hypothetical protein
MLTVWPHVSRRHLCELAVLDFAKIACPPVPSHQHLYFVYERTLLKLVFSGSLRAPPLYIRGDT